MKISRTSLLFAVCMASSMCVLVAQFVAQPKKKVPSTGKIKEQCAQAFGRQLTLFAHIMESLGNVQSKVLEHTYALIENDADNALNKKNNVALQQCHDKMCALNESLAALEQELQEYRCFIEQL